MRDKSTETVAIIGQGYVGLPLAMALVEANWHVIGFDSDKDKISLLNSGLSPIEDIDKSSILESINSGKYVPTTEIKHLLKAKLDTSNIASNLDKNLFQSLIMADQFAHL